MYDQDGMDEAFHGTFTMLMTSAASVAARVADLHAQRVRADSAEQHEEAARLSSQLTAERAAATAEISLQLRRRNVMNPEEAARAWTLAEAWATRDPEVVTLRDQLAERIKSERGFDPRNTTARTATELAGIATVVQADRAQAAAELAYDSPERRANTANARAAAGLNKDLVDVTVRADIANAEPPTSAPAAAAHRARKSGRALTPDKEITLSR